MSELHSRIEQCGDRDDARLEYTKPEVQDIVALQAVVMGSFDTTGDSGTLGPPPT